MSNKADKPLEALSRSQQLASDPREHAWLSASAGSGKTQVLTSRVFRLLYREVDPASILSLTYTRAGAAEMANRINETLARWVRMDDAKLATDLRAIGESVSPQSLAHARTLFARVLDVPGGLRIQTIHSFAQSLLGSFPIEAGLLPGFELVEGRDQQALVEEAIAAALAEPVFARDIEPLSMRMGADEARAYLMRCAQQGPAFHELGPEELIADRIWRGLDLPPGSDEQALLPRFGDDAVRRDELVTLASLCATMTGKTGPKVAEAIHAFIALEPAVRFDRWRDVRKAVLKADGDINQNVLKLGEKEPAIADPLARLAQWLREIETLFDRYRLAAHLARSLRAGATVARHYRDLKHGRAAVDFNDLIHHLHQLLTRPDMGDWVRFKLDQQTDHVLIDEAQDTNQRQWEIIEALTQEYFAGEGAVERHRSLFVVGDFKQAIFSFQGTNPAAFQNARERFATAAGHVQRPFKEISLDTSYRSLSAVLECVDAVLADQGASSLGLPDQPNRHVSFREKPGGAVMLWKPVTPADVLAEADMGMDMSPDDDEVASEEAENSADIDDSKRGAEALLARRIARQIRQWLGDDPLFLSQKSRIAEAGDFMILVRNRGFLARQIIARLHDCGVPVAGIDRMQLQDALAVQDMLAAMRFATQPEDDLNLASLLVSPLIGLDQNDLFDLAWGRPTSLWRALRNRDEEQFVAARHALDSLLGMADLVSPHGFFEQLLSGPIRGRARMIARLGLEVLDPIEELLVTALDQEQQGISSFAAFLAVMDRAQDEIKREQEGAQHQVRIMTVHGAKGLQAPVVILADATSDPDDRREDVIAYSVEGEANPLPVPLSSSESCHERVAKARDEAKAGRDQEHRRLLYVALTRAEEVLCLGGAIGRVQRGNGLHRWHGIVQQAMETQLAVTAQPDDLWGEVWVHDRRPKEKGRAGATRRSSSFDAAPQLPEWIDRPAPAEAKPPRPLAPSQLGEDMVVDPPGDDPRAEAMIRGTLLHGLFERLPGVEPDRRAALADIWLMTKAPDRDGSWRARLTQQALSIIGDPAHQALFGPDGLAEVPLSAVVGDRVITGVVDRILIDDHLVHVVDFKTGRRVPSSANAISEHHLRQMAAYRDALRVIFPGKIVRASLLYTSGPALYELDDDVLDKAGTAQALPTQ